MDCWFVTVVRESFALHRSVSSAWGKQVFRIGVVTMYREVLFPVVEERDQSAY